MSAGFRSVNSEDSSLGLVNFSSQYDSKICPRECVTKTEKMSNISKRKNITDDPIIIIKWESYEKYQKKIAVGGEWFLKPRKSNQKRLVLVAGGVGINPILSMVRQLASNDDGWERDWL